MMNEATHACKVERLEEFDVSVDTGFVPDCEPLCRLPEYFSAWEDVCDQLPQSWKEGVTRTVIEKLPLLDHNKLRSVSEWRRAGVVLSFMSHSYVWCQGEQGPAKVLPKCLAVPWVAVTKHLGLPPVLVHYLYALYNWKKVDSEGPLDMNNMRPINTFTGTKSEEGFILIAVQVELEFGKGVQNIIASQKAVCDTDINMLKEALVGLQQMILRLRVALARMHDVCDPKDFYCLVRIFLNGWQASSALQDGLIYEGVSSVPAQYAGGSAAESTVFQVLDAFLGIQHFSSPAKLSFLEKMRDHMPPKHREFISAVRNGPRIREYVIQSKDEALVKLYNACVEGLQEYRTYHLSIVSKYIIIQANRDPDNPNRCLASKGTGGSDLMNFLRRIRNETKDMKISLT